MIGVILAAGDGTRLNHTAGEDCCKALKQIRGAYLIEYSLNNLIALGIPEACIVVGKQAEQIRKAVGNSYKGMKVSYAIQKQQKGLMNAFVQALDTVGDRDVLLQLADEIFVGLRKQDILTWITEAEQEFCCGITYEEDRERIKSNYSVETDEAGFLQNCIEKPAAVTDNRKGTGLCIFRRGALQVLREIYDDVGNTPRELCDYMRALLDRDKKGSAVQVAEKEYNINTVSDLAEFLTEHPDA